MSYIKSEMKSKMRILHTLRINCVAVSGECQPSLRSLNRPTSLILCDWSLNIFIIHFKSGKMNEYTGMGALGIAVQTRGFYIFLPEEFNSCFSQLYYNDIITLNNTMWFGDMITQVFSHNIGMTGPPVNGCAASQSSIKYSLFFYPGMVQAGTWERFISS